MNSRFIFLRYNHDSPGNSFTFPLDDIQYYGFETKYSDDTQIVNVKLETSEADFNFYVEHELFEKALKQAQWLAVYEGGRHIIEINPRDEE